MFGLHDVLVLVPSSGRAKSGVIRVFVSLKYVYSAPIWAWPVPCLWPAIAAAAARSSSPLPRPFLNVCHGNQLFATVAIAVLSLCSLGLPLVRIFVEMHSFLFSPKNR